MIWKECGTGWEREPRASLLCIASLFSSYAVLLYNTVHTLQLPNAITQSISPSHVTSPKIPPSQYNLCAGYCFYKCMQSKLKRVTLAAVHKRLCFSVHWSPNRAVNYCIFHLHKMSMRVYSSYPLLRIVNNTFCSACKQYLCSIVLDCPRPPFLLVFQWMAMVLRSYTVKAICAICLIPHATCR